MCGVSLATVRSFILQSQPRPQVCLLGPRAPRTLAARSRAAAACACGPVKITSCSIAIEVLCACKSKCHKMAYYSYPSPKLERGPASSAITPLYVDTLPGGSVSASEPQHGLDFASPTLFQSAASQSRQVSCQAGRGARMRDVSGGAESLGGLPRWEIDRHNEIIRALDQLQFGPSVLPAGEVEDPQQTYQELCKKNRRKYGKKRLHCGFCKKNKELPLVFSSHLLRDKLGNIACPILRSYVCELCGATEDQAHTKRYCPLNPNGAQDRPQARVLSHIGVVAYGPCW